MQANLADLRVVSVGLDHPEAVTRGPDGALYAGGEAGQIYRIPARGGAPEEIANVGGFVLGLCCDAANAVYACSWGASSRVARVAPDGTISTYCDSAEDEPLGCPNFNAFAPDGSMWLSDSGPDFPAPGDGRLLRIPAGGGDADVMDVRPFNFSNGLCVAPDGAVFVVESYHQPGVVVYRDGTVSEYVSLPRSVPDGVALAESGALYVSCYQPSVIFRVPPGGGSADVFLEDWMGIRLLSPTNVAFFDEGLRSLAIAGISGWDIRAIELSENGQPLFYPSL
jgi:gluconolactonase